MTYRQIEQKLSENRHILRTTSDPSLKSRLILEDHELMIEMDRRWKVTQRTAEARTH